MPLVKAKITDVSHANSKPVSVLFNPTDLAVDRGSHYASMPVPGLSMPILQYIRGESDVLHLELFLDRTDEGRDVEGDIAAKTRRVLDNLKAMVTEAGFSWDDVVKTTVFLKDMGQFTAMNEAYGAYFPRDPPARSTIQAARLPRDIDVEIECIAYKGGK